MDIKRRRAYRGGTSLVTLKFRIHAARTDTQPPEPTTTHLHHVKWSSDSRGGGGGAFNGTQTGKKRTAG